MPQQINLYSPILLAPRRLFSATAIAQAASVLVLGLAAFAGWSVFATQRLQADLAATSAAHDAEKRHLLALVAARPTLPRDTTGLQQEVAQARQTLQTRRALLAELSGGGGTGGGALLQLLTETAPASLWLDEVRRVEGRVELRGVTQQPETLRPWLAALSAHPALGGQPLALVQVERSDTDTDAWRFRATGGLP